MADNTKQLAEQSFFVFVKDSNNGKVRRVAIPGDVQIGLQGNPAELQLLGRLSLATTPYNTSNTTQGNLYIKNNDTIVLVSLVDTPSSGRITLHLPANPRNGQLHFIKDMSGTADVVPIDIEASAGVLIDQDSVKSITSQYGSMALFWFGDHWRVLIAGGSSSSSGAPGDATYVTLSTDPTLTNERRLNVSGTNLTMTDQGANASVILDLTSILGGGAGTFTYSTITVDAFGRITAASSGVAPPPAGASYITVTNEPGLSAERQLVPGTGLLLSDGGPNGSITASINNNVVATLSGSSFFGPIIAQDGMTGSIQRTFGGLSYLVAGPNVTITSQSNGQIIIASTSGSGGSSAITIVTGSGGVINYHAATYSPLLGLWSLSGTLNDSSSFISNLTCSAGNTRYTSMGPGMRGMMFDGASFLTLTASLPTVLATACTGALTFETLINVEPPAAGTTPYLIAITGLAGDVNGSENGLFSVYVNSNGTIGLSHERDGGTNSDFATMEAIPFNKLSHLAVTRTDGGVYRVYVDGALMGISTALAMPNTGTVAASSARFNFGFFPNTNFSTTVVNDNLTNTSMASMKLIGRALTDAEVAAEYYYTLGNLFVQTTVVTGAGGSGGSGADVSASYVVIGNTGSLPNERRLEAGTGIDITDNGPNSSVVISAQQAQRIPIITFPILAGIATTNEAHSASKLSIGSTYYNTGVIGALPTGKRIFWRGIIDAFSTEPNLSASVDLYDVNGVVAWPPGSIVNSAFSSSNPSQTFFSIDLTTALGSITGSGIIEARLWRTVSGSMTSSVTCRNARLEVEAVAVTIPMFSMQALAGVVTTNTATSGSKQALGSIYFDPTLINSFPGSRTYRYNAIVDSTELPVSAAIDLYDVNGIVQFPPGVIQNSTISSSNPSMTYINIDLTSVLSVVTGSGIIEARLWKTVSGSLTSSVTCRNAKLDVEYS